MTARRFVLVLAAGLLAAGGAFAFQWSPGPEDHELDLLVVGTLVGLHESVVRANGRVYDLERGTILVDRVLYAEQGARLGPTVELFSGNASPGMPNLDHAPHALCPGVWRLQRSHVDGVYTSYMGTSYTGEEALARLPAGARITGGIVDPGTNTVSLDVRYECFQPEPATVEELSIDAAGAVRGLAGSMTLEGYYRSRPGRPEATLTRSPEPARRTIHVNRWSYVRGATLHLALPAALVGCSCIVGSTTPGQTPRDGFMAREPADPHEPAIFLSPGTPTTPLVPWPPATLLVLLTLLGALPLVTRGGTWRWTRNARALGVGVCAAALALLPWSVLGPACAGLLSPLTPLAAALEAALLGGLWLAVRRAPRHRRGIRLAALLQAAWLAAPLLVMLGLR